MTEAELDDLLSTPRAETSAALAACPGDVVVLGAGGKMGPDARAHGARAPRPTIRRVIAVSRWSSAAARVRARTRPASRRCAPTCSTATPSTELPDAPNVIFMAGQKFGTTGAPAHDLGDEHDRPGELRRALPRLAHRRVLDGQRVRAHADRVRRVARDRRARAGRRVRGVVPGARARVRAVRRAAWNARRDRAAQLRDRSALRRARRHRAQGEARQAGVAWTWAT